MNFYTEINFFSCFQISSFNIYSNLCGSLNKAGETSAKPVIMIFSSCRTHFSRFAGNRRHMTVLTGYIFGRVRTVLIFNFCRFNPDTEIIQFIVTDSTKLRIFVELRPRCFMVGRPGKFKVTPFWINPRSSIGNIVMIKRCSTFKIFNRMTKIAENSPVSEKFYAAFLVPEAIDFLRICRSWRIIAGFISRRRVAPYTTGCKPFYLFISAGIYDSKFIILCLEKIPGKCFGHL